MRTLFLCFLFGLSINAVAQPESRTFVQGALVRGDTTKRELALVFTADEFGEGLPVIRKTLKQKEVKGSFFFTGRFYRTKAFRQEIRKLAQAGHYLGPHSDQHLLCCDWTKRDSLLVTRDSFEHDIRQNLGAMIADGLPVLTPHFFIPPYEWWNDSITVWSKAQGLTLFNFTPGIRTNADYTWPELGTAYKSTAWIMNWLKETFTTDPTKFNGAILLIHAGTDPRRKDKLYEQLSEIILLFKTKGFRFKRIDDLLNEN
jgi:peptidoglycan/xylan/chitin deacetylase (PgdA/CDA1 family)